MYLQNGVKRRRNVEDPVVPAVENRHRLLVVAWNEGDDSLHHHMVVEPCDSAVRSRSYPPFVPSDGHPTIWPLDPHTRAKHALLAEYLKAWFPILSWNSRVVFLDGFAGPGIYAGGEPGSPVIALDVLLNHTAKGVLNNCTFSFLFVEANKARYESLRSEVAKLGELPTNVKVEFRNTTFVEAADSLAGYLEQQRKRLAPTFAFLDPFGFGGIPIDTIKRLLGYRGSELFVSFMLDHVNRFAEVPSESAHMEALFGTTEYLQAAAEPDRLEALGSLYEQQLHKKAGFEYVSRFQMRRVDGHIAYHLLHGTNHPRGVEVMKSAMWKVDPGGGCRFMDRFAGQEVLFAGDNVDVGPLRQGMLKHFAGKTVTPADIQRFTVLETPFAPNHWNRKVLKPLEDEAIVQVTRPAGKRRGTFTEGTVIRFPVSVIR